MMRSRIARIKGLYILFAILTLPILALGQVASKRYSASTIPVTSNTAFMDMSKSKKESGKSSLKYIYKTDPQPILSGNRCAEEYTRSLGFVYVIVLPEEDGDANLGNFFHNLGTSIALTFRNGPFWSHKVKKRIEKCKMSSGDFVG
jgi:hypothetical protein